MNTKEVQTVITLYFDWLATADAPILSYSAARDYSLFTGVVPSDNIMCRYSKCTISCLPKFSNSAIAQDSFLVTSSVRGYQPDASDAYSLMGISTKLVHPTANTDWVTVAVMDYDAIFSSSQVVANNLNGAMEMFVLGVYNPDSGEPFAGEIQFRVELVAEVPINPMSEWKVSPQYLTATTEAPVPEPRDQLAQVQPRQLRNTV